MGVTHDYYIYNSIRANLIKYYFMKREKDYEHKNNKLYINEFGRFFNSGRRMW